MKRKFFALIMAAVLCLGMSMTAFAAERRSGVQTEVRSRLLRRSCMIM